METARALEESGDVAGAVALFRNAAAIDEIARLVVTKAPEVLDRGGAQTLLGWLELLTPDLIDRTPWLLHWRAVARQWSSPRAAVEDAERALALFADAGEAAGAYAAWSCAVQLIAYAIQDDHAQLDRWIARLRQLRERFPTWPSVGTEAAVVSAAFAAYSLRDPRSAELTQYSGRALEIALSPGDPRLRLGAGLQVAIHGMLVGDAPRVGNLLSALRPLVRDGHALPGQHILWSVVEGLLRLHLGDAVGALAEQRVGSTLAEQHALHQWDGLLINLRLLAHVALDQLDGAGTMLTELAAAAKNAPRLIAYTYHMAAGILTLRRKDVRAALEHGRMAESIARDVGSAVNIATACVLHAVARERAGEPALADAARFCRDAAVPLREYGALLSLASVALARGDEGEAARAVEAGFAVGQRIGTYWVDWLSRDELADLCALALERGIAPDFALNAIRACGLRAPPRARHVPSWPWPARIEALGGFALRRDGAEPRTGKAQRKPLELLQLLVAHGERGAPLARLAEELWPDADGDTAQHALDTTIHRLRRLLADPAALVRRGGRASLDPNLVFVDAWAFESLAARAEARRARGDLAEALRAAAAAADLYRGDLLPDDDLPGILSDRERLRARADRLRSSARA